VPQPPQAWVVAARKKVANAAGFVSAAHLGATIVPVRRALLVVLAGTLVLGLIGLATASGRGDAGPAGATLRAPADTATLPPTPPPAQSVPAASGAVLAEMTRVQGTPRAVTAIARRHARRAAREEARLRAIARARAAAAARRAAAARAAATLPYWQDQGAASVASSAPSSPAEAAWLQGGRGGWVEPSGYARAPANAPPAIQQVIAAGNQIARAPYLWGGGHGEWQDKGYDCSGSVSYALAAGGMLGYTLTSGQLMDWGAPGPGKWLTIYANKGHVFMYVAGLRFDTSGAGDHASRWQLAPRTAAGFVARHYPGL
jgi:cell wall-associated NlpC family hydrolase